MPVDLFSLVAECGCAAKLPARELSQLLRGMDLPTLPGVVIGPELLDDGGVFKLPRGECLVQTVDFFPPAARDPEDYGKIATANALSDIYAMGGTPLTALSIVCFPAQLVQAGALRGVLQGACEKLREAGCALLGGHSVIDKQPKFGLAVTGLVAPESVLSNANARPGDLLYLTKPLGTGATIMAVMAKVAGAEEERAANASMATLNAKAAELARACGARAATDITGFGLLGHAMQLAKASGVALEIDVDGLPLLDGALGFAAQGLLPAATYSNRDYVSADVDFESSVPLPVRDLLFDPQTSGGLLICCPPEQAAQLARRGEQELATPGGVIGRVVAADGRPLISVRGKVKAS